MDADIFQTSSALNFLMNKILNSELCRTFEVSVTYFYVNLSCILAMAHKHTIFPTPDSSIGNDRASVFLCSSF